eukprot:CAMPEP_0182423658 /NCGR_PEP_ID=MMETSP1167-20130531/9733_1 /TAXON_ID=2988 /ORGANISM="Mallomonas Sp, Strain CCMP3275" /LENGTH=171 /DNA_ID=CAMNT_0024602839 /DNA_START=67 /DNA_END=582 /DNA_ORIENTATION=-
MILNLDTELPVHILLVLLALCVQWEWRADSRPAESCVNALFELAKQYERSVSSGTSEDERESDSLQREREREREADENTTSNMDEISRSSLEMMITSLVQTCQVPGEKRVIETGVKWPFKQYREKNASEMVTDAQLAFKPPHTNNSFTLYEAQDIILGYKVCMWGECYRSH